MALIENRKKNRTKTLARCQNENENWKSSNYPKRTNAIPCTTAKWQKGERMSMAGIFGRKMIRVEFINVITPNVASLFGEK